MSVFIKKDIKTTNINPFNMIGSDWFALTAKKGDKVNTMTAGWGGFGVMWGKNVAYIVVRDSRYTKEFMDSADSFSMTFFDNSPENKKILGYLGSVSGRNEDKIKNSGLNVDYYEDTPYINEGSTVYICKKLYLSPMPADCFIDVSIDSTWYSDKDYHNLYIGEITALLHKSL